MIETIASPERQRGQDKMDTLPRYRRECDVRLCSPRRLPKTASSQRRTAGQT